MKKAVAIYILLALLLSFTACAPATARGFSMGSDYYVTYDYDGDLDEEIASLFASVEMKYSARVETSVVSRINAAATGQAVTLTKEEADVLSLAFTLASDSDNGFDPAIMPLVKLWGFDPPFDMNGKVPPSDLAITEAMYLSGMDQFIYYNALSMITKRSQGAALDLGAAVKGLAVSQVADMLRAKNVKQALVYLGGTIAAVGRSYEIGVTPPRDSDESFAFRFTLEDGEVCATSGDYERYYEYEGKRYHHILDARTGYPADSGVISATVVAEDGMIADAFATAVVVLGAEKGAALLERYGLKGAFVTQSKKVVTVGLSVTIKDKSYEIA